MRQNFELEINTGQSVLTLDARLVHDDGRDPKDANFRHYRIAFIRKEKNQHQPTLLIDRLRFAERTSS